MTELNPGRTGAKRLSWEKYNLRELLKDEIRSNPRATEAEISDLMWESIQHEKGYLRPLFDYWFTNNYKRFFVEEISDNETALHTRVGTRTVNEKNNGNIRTLSNVKEQLKTVLMDHVLSNGKLLRDATFRDCSIEGGWLSTIAKQGKPKEIVGKKLTEKDVQSLMMRAKKK